MRFCSLLLFAAAAVACSNAPSAARAPQAPPPAGPATTVVLPRQVVTPDSAIGVNELYERGERKARAGDLAGAAADLDRVYQLDPDGPLALGALFRAAEAWDLLKDNERALERYEQVARRYPAHDLGREALVRSMRLLCFLERWRRASELAELYFAREPAPRPFEAVVAHSARALALIDAGDDAGAMRSVEKGRDVVEAHGLDLAGRLPRDLAQLYFALGEVRRVRAERIEFTPLPPNFAEVFEQRCQLLLDAQSAYSDTMRAYDSHWSAMAGFRVGELYQSLHVDVMRIEPPKSADTERKRQLFEGAMRLRYSVLLDKARGMMEHTLSMARRTGEDSAWVERAERAKLEIERAQAAEQAALERLPYTRAELQAALLRLARGKPP